ncbi:hypothetical protein BMS3Bbin10_00637 [bacterium BMS3Bbin10]|nr:hypothetical protein BMS3Bbin10_00637 [bacterium BMS3Bbin10]
MGKFITLAIALAFFAAADQASGAPMPVKPVIAGDESLVVRVQEFQIQLGLSDGLIFSALSRRGYSDIRITKRKLTKARAEACRNGKKYKIQIGFDGGIRKVVEIGSCRPAINAETARRILRQKGFRKIQLGPDGAGFIAAACRNNRRFRVSLDQFGDIRGEKLLGRCGNILTKYDVAALLRAQGYSRVRAERGRRGRFSVQACRRDEAVVLEVGNDGAILGERRVGRCDPPIHPATIPALLARYGFTRIEIIDRRLPRYIAQACRDTQRLEISMNRFGEIVGERSIGRCEPPLSAAGLKVILRDAGYDGVRIIKDRPGGFTAEVCEEGARFRLELTRYGETLSEQRLGDCPSRRVRKILKQFERQGVTGATMYVEGCRKKKRVRIELDQHGTPVRRNVIGRCR